MLDNQGAPNPLSVRAYVIINPVFSSGSKRAKQEKCAFVVNENVRSDRNL
jgi:hypothetical protein